MPDFVGMSHNQLTAAPSSRRDEVAKTKRKEGREKKNRKIKKKIT